MLDKIRNCFHKDKVLYSKHAKSEMETEEFGVIMANEVHEAILTGKIINEYIDDEPYPSCLIFGRTKTNRPLHIVCAYSGEDNITIVITVYEPDPQKWIDYVPKEWLCQEEKKMKCIICKSDDIELKKVDEEIKFENDIILIPIEVLVCNNCGERYYDGKTIRHLETVKEKIENKEIAVEDIGKVLRPKVA